MLDLSEKRLNKTIFHLAWPAILESLLQMTIFVTDSIMIGPLGTHAFAAVGQGSMMASYMIFPLWSLGTATSAVVARYIGAQDMKSARKGAGQGIFLAILIGLVYTCAGVYFAGDFLILIGTPQEIAESSGVYLAILLGFCGFQAIRLVGSSILRATGDTRTPMWATAVMNVFNILANWVLIYGIGPFPRMEVAGVALASGLSYVISACIVMWKLTRKNPVFFFTRSDMTQIARDILRTILRIAGPNMAEMVLMRAGGLTYIWIVTSLGTVSLAAHYMAIRVESFAFMPAFGLAMAVPPLVGQALGAGKPEMAILAVRRTVKAGVYGMIVLGFLFILIPGVFVRIFSPEPDVYFIASIVVQISALELIGVTLNMIYGGAMRGAGDTVSPMIVTFVGAIIIRISLVYWMTILLGWGLSGVWIATAIDWSLRAIVGWILFRRGRWQNIKV